MTDYKIAHSQINIKDEYYINLGISKEKFDQIVDSKNNLDDLLSQRKKDDELYEHICKLTIDGNDKFSIIKNIPDVKVKDGKKFTAFLTEKLIQLLYK